MTTARIAITVASLFVASTAFADVSPRLEGKKRPENGISTNEPWGGGIRLTGLSGIGALPGVNFGGEVAGNVRRDEVFVELALARWAPEETYNVTMAPGERVELKLSVWALRVGWASMKMPIRAWALAEVGEMAGTGGVGGTTGVVSRMMMGNTPSERQWRAIGGGVGVAWPLSNQARMVGNLELAIPIHREVLMLDRGGGYEPDPIAPRYSVGLEVGWR